MTRDSHIAFVLSVHNAQPIWHDKMFATQVVEYGVNPNVTTDDGGNELPAEQQIDEQKQRSWPAGDE